MKEINKENLRILFMGTPTFAKESLQTLIDNKFNVVGLFCQPDKPKDRGMQMTQPVTKVLALENNIEVYQPIRLKDSDEVKQILEKIRPDLIIVVAYGKILPKYILDYPKYGCINVHGSILPKYRGAAPIQWSIINGEKETGITTMYMDEGMDTGDMILKEAIEIKENDTYGSLHDKLAKLGANLLLKTLDSLLDGNITREKQEGEYTLAPMLTRENTKIDFNEKAENIVNLIRGTNPFPASYAMLDEIRLYKIYEAEKYEYIDNSNGKNGQILCLDAKQDLFLVKCKEGCINIKVLKPAGSRCMTASEYIRGNKVKVGEIFI